MKRVLLIFEMFILISLVQAQYIRPIIPKNGQMIFSNTLHFKWNKYENITTYHLQIATDTNFTHLLVNIDVNGTDTIVKGFWQDTTFYWRLQPQGGTYGPCLSFIYFTPRMIPDLVGWYSADSCHVIGESIDTLYDKSGKHAHLLQSTSSARPQKIDADTNINGKASIYFNGSNYFYTYNTLNYAQPNSYYFIWDQQTGIGGCYISGRSASSRNQLYFDVNSKQFSQYAGTSVRNDTIIKRIMQFKYSLFKLLFNRINSYTYMNNECVVNGNVGANSQYGLILGSACDYSLKFKGYTPELIFYNKILDSVQNHVVTQYLSEKYHGRLNLGEDIITASLCPVTLQADKDYVSYLWSTGDTTPGIKVQTSGKYWLTTINRFGWKETDTIEVYMNMSVVKDTQICYGDSVVWNYTQQYPYSFQWSNGQNGVFTSGTAGKYYVQMTDSLQCTAQLDFEIQVDSLPYHTAIMQEDSMCHGNAIELSYPRTVNGYNIVWSTGDTANIGTTFSHTGWYSVQVENELGCIGKDSLYIIKKGNAPLTAFTATNICMGDSTVFTNTSTTNDGTNIALSEWYMGDGAAYTPLNAMESFKHLYDTSGMYIVTLHCVTDAGCEQEYRQSVSVYSFPQPDFTPVLACQHSPVSFANLTRSEYRVGNYTWHFTPHDSSILALPEYTYHDTGMHTVQLIAANVMGCTDTMEHTLYVKPNPQATFTHNQPCVGNTLYLNDITPLPVEQKAVNRTWSVNGVLLYGTANHAQYAIDKEGNYRATLNMQYLNGCSSTAEADIIVHSLPQASFSVSPACQYDTLSISTATMAGLNYEWHYMGHTYTGSMPVISADSTGKHPLMLYVYDNNHCTDSAMQQVMVSPSPKADFSYDYAPHGLYTIQFTNHSLRADSYTWQFDNMGMSSEKHPVFDFLTAGTYEVSLSVANSGACTHEQKQQLILPEHRVEVSLMDFQLIEQNGTVRPQVLVLNRSNRVIPLLQYTFTYNNEQIYETDSLPLPAGEMRLYTFRTAMAAKQQADYACISLSTPYDDCPSADTDREKCLLLNKADFVQTPYPNPAHNNITLCYGLQAESEVTWQIYDVGGRQLYNCTHKQQAGGIYHKHIDIASLAQGLYILKVSIGEQVYSYKFNKQSN